jgi:hypothetical protein
MNGYENFPASYGIKKLKESECNKTQITNSKFQGTDTYFITKIFA